MKKTRGKLLSVHVNGKLEKADFEHFMPVFNQLVRQLGKLRVLFDITDFHGWEACTMWEGISEAINKLDCRLAG